MSDTYKFYNGIRLEPLSADPNSPVEGQIQFADGTARAKGTWEYKDGAWSQSSGSGGGLDIFYLEDFETSVSASDFTTGNNATYDNGGTLDGTLADETSTPISGSSSLKYTMSSSSTNDWVKSPTISLDLKQKSTTVGMTIYYTYNGNNDDIKFVAYDNTNSEILTIDTALVKASTIAKRGTIQFPIPSDCSSLSWGFQVVTGNSGKIFKVYDVEISTNPIVSKEITISDTCRLHTGNGHGSTNTHIRRLSNIAFQDDDYTFSAISASQNSPNGLFTVTDSAGSGTEITILKKGRYTFSYSDGASSAYQHGLSLNSSQLTTALGSITIADRLIIAQDTAANNTAVASVALDLEIGDVVRPHTDSSPDFSTNVKLTIYGEVDTENILSYNSRNAENLVVQGAGNGGTALTASVTNMDFTETVDTGYGGSNWNGTQFTVPENGIYSISGFVIITTTTAFEIQLYKDGTYFSSIGGDAASTIDRKGFSTILNLTKGEVISLRSSSSVTLFNEANRHTISITKLGSNDLVGIPRSLVGYIDTDATDWKNSVVATTSYKTVNLESISGDVSKFGTIASDQLTLEVGRYYFEVPVSPYNNAQNISLAFYDIDAAAIDQEFTNISYSSTTVSPFTTVTFTKEITASTTFEFRTKASNAAGNEMHGRIKITKVN